MLNSSKELYLLTILRGIAAIWVVFYHIAERVSPYVGETASIIIKSGYLAVDFFFVLSGFVIALNYQSHFKASINKTLMTNFMIKRLARIYPLHLFIVFAYLIEPAAFYLTGRDYDFNTLVYISNIFLVNNWGILTALPINVPSWSISTELFAYLLFPFLAFFINKKNKLLHLILLFLMFNFVLISWFYINNVPHIGYDITRNGLVRCVCQFALGIVIYNALTKSKKQIMVFLVVLFLFAAFTVKMDNNFFFIPSVMSLILIAAIYIESKQSFDYLKPLIWLGNISYSIYLSHYLIRDIFKLILVEGHTPLWWIISYFCTVIIVSHYLYTLIEIESKKRVLNYYFK